MKATAWEGEMNRKVELGDEMMRGGMMEMQDEREYMDNQREPRTTFIQ